MFASNPFADLTVFLSPLVMQAYIVLMILAVAIGTLYISSSGPSEIGEDHG